MKFLRPRGVRRVEGTDGEAGFTLVEVMVSLVVLALFSVAIAAVLVETQVTTRTNRQRSVAAGLVSRDLEVVRQQVTAPTGANHGLTTVPVGAVTVTSQPVVDGTTYTLTRSSQWTFDAAVTSPCANPVNGQPAFLRVTTTATWPAMGGIKPVTSDTLITPLVGAFNGASGNVAVSLVRANGTTGTSGAQVTLSGTTGAGAAYSATQSTSSDGCAFFAFVPVGAAYSAVVSDPTGQDVNSDGGATLTTSAIAVLANQTASVAPQYYDTHATLVPAAVTPLAADASHPVPTGIGVTLQAPSYKTGVATGVPLASQPSVLGNLFPWTYSVWPGECAGSDPGAANRSTASLTAGSTTTSTWPATLKLTALDATASTFTPGNHIYARNSGSCPVGAPVLDLGALTSANLTMKASLPPGTYNLSLGATAAASAAATQKSVTVGNSAATVTVTP